MRPPRTRMVVSKTEDSWSLHGRTSVTAASVTVHTVCGVLAFRTGGAEM